MMHRRIAHRLSATTKALRRTAGIAVVAAAGVGILEGPYVRAHSIGTQVPLQGTRPAFEVASVKPIDRATLSRGHEGHQLTRERFVDRTELIQYIVRAYLGGSSCAMTATPAFGYKCPMLSGSMPAWVKSDMFEIQAKMAAGSVPNYTRRQLQFGNTPELNVMLQVLLEDRFHLKVHWEMKAIPVYALTVARNGPKLKPSSPGSEFRKTSDGSLIEVHGNEGISRVPTSNGTVRMRFHFRAGSMPEAARDFSFYFDRPVVDRTGLKGDYDFVIEYEDDPEARIPLPGSSIELGPFNPFSGLTSSALSTALQAIGLKLESTKAPVQILVIDHVEKPSEN